MVWVVLVKTVEIAIIAQSWWFGCEKQKKNHLSKKTIVKLGLPPANKIVSYWAPLPHFWKLLDVRNLDVKITIVVL